MSLFHLCVCMCVKGELRAICQNRRLISTISMAPSSRLSSGELQWPSISPLLPGGSSVPVPSGHLELYTDFTSVATTTSVYFLLSTFPAALPHLSNASWCLPKDDKSPPPTFYNEVPPPALQQSHLLPDTASIWLSDTNQ